ncbi:SDR family NAD(P)-dependent oxidoreductase [Desulfopila aestuarii]|nr:SDR family NAD(P)-dependent oxidoreductase [Desulfopila aestuarii]
MNQPKVALVTGGSRGIGLATVRLLCSRSITTIFTCRNPHDGQLALSELGPLARLADFHPLELTDNASVSELAEYIRRKYGYLDILINNAGVNYDTWQRVSKVAISEVEYTLDVNLLGPWRMCNVMIPLMLSRGNARIINVSSGAGCIAQQDGSAPAYSLSKNGLNMLTKSMDSDLQNTGIAVNAADPGWVRTDMGGSDAPKSPEEGADTIVWLATEADLSISGKLFRNRTAIDW